jgi:hypothetical protein
MPASAYAGALRYTASTRGRFARQRRTKQYTPSYTSTTAKSQSAQHAVYAAAARAQLCGLLEGEGCSAILRGVSCVL